MAWWFSSKNEAGRIGLIDIGTAAVSFAIMEPSPQKDQTVTRVTYTTEQVLPQAADPDFKRLLAETVAAIGRALAGAVKDGQRLPTHYHCFLPSLFSVAQTKVLSYREDQDFIFERKLMEDICQREIASFQEKNADSTDKFQLVENKIIQIKLNGYEISKPFGQKAKTATIVQYVSGSPASVLEALRGAIKKQNHHDSILFHSFPVAAYGALHTLLGTKQSFLALEVGGELTTVCLIRHGILLESLSFPCGQSTVVRELASRLSSSYPETLSTLQAAARRELAAESVARLTAPLEAGRNLWQNGLAEALTALSETTVLPETAIVMAPSGLDKLFSDWLKKGGTENYTLSHAPVTVKLLSELVPSFALSAERKNLPSPLLLESVFYDTQLALDKS